MAVSHRYRNFGKAGPASPQPPASNEEAIEDLKLQSFETGYQAGWDDAIKAQAEDQAKIGAELGQNLQAISFAYHEALTKLTGSMQPVLEQMIHKLLPEMAQNALGAHIVEQVMSLANERISGPVEIVVADANVEKVAMLAGESLTEPFEVVGESSLGEGQAFVRLGEDERLVDLDAVVSGVSEAFVAFFHEAKTGDDK